jgi:hypothetical protein
VQVLILTTIASKTRMAHLRYRIMHSTLTTRQERCSSTNPRKCVKICSIGTKPPLRMFLTVGNVYQVWCSSRRIVSPSKTISLAWGLKRRWRRIINWYWRRGRNRIRGRICTRRDTRRRELLKRLGGLRWRMSAERFKEVLALGIVRGNGRA